MAFRKSSAFTLIELLIVVAIIAILAAIAVPNFLEAQVRSKVSREKTNMRTLATALESYRVDTNHYPMDELWYILRTDPMPIPPLIMLTTPVAYISSLPEAMFYDKKWVPNDATLPDGVELWHNRMFRYGNRAEASGTWYRGLLMALYSLEPKGEFKTEWVLTTLGPDLQSNQGWYAIYGEDLLNQVPAYPANFSGPGCFYDPTNGTMSAGDMIRLGP